MLLLWLRGSRQDLSGCGKCPALPGLEQSPTFLPRPPVRRLPSGGDFLKRSERPCFCALESRNTFGNLGNFPKWKSWFPASLAPAVSMARQVGLPGPWSECCSTMGVAFPPLAPLFLGIPLFPDLFQHLCNFCCVLDMALAFPTCSVQPAFDLGWEENMFQAKIQTFPF